MGIPTTAKFDARIRREIQYGAQLTAKDEDEWRVKD
jgi:hypothetical protein